MAKAQCSRAAHLNDYQAKPAAQAVSKIMSARFSHRCAGTLVVERPELDGSCDLDASLFPGKNTVFACY
jgi:hypothetical protein